VHRAANGKPFLFGEIPNVRAIAADHPVPQAPVPVVRLDDVISIADHVLAFAETVDGVIAALNAQPLPTRVPLRR